VRTLGNAQSMSGLPPERRLSKFLGVFSFGLGVAQLAAPERVNELIGIKDTKKTRAIQRAVGVQELTAAQGIFAFSPPTPVLWTRVAGDVLHSGLLVKALGNRRNDKSRVRGALAAVAGIGVIDALVASRYQAAWPKEPTPGESLPATRDSEPMEEHYEGHPAVTIRATEAEIRPRLQEFEIEELGNVVFRKAPGERGTEVIVETSKNGDKVKANLRKVKQVVETGEVVRSDAAPEGGTPKRQIVQRPAQPLKEKELAKAGGRN
jgi:hypothetical protein